MMRRKTIRLALAAGLALAAWAGASGRAQAQAQGVFQIDQRFASINFSVDHLGLFTSHGDFARFMGRLAIDPARPELTSITVNIDAQSVDLDSASPAASANRIVLRRIILPPSIWTAPRG
jgi:polyisoprenoid-binding protein YceI